EMIARYDIRVASPRQVAGTLSGGNQQKTVVARALYFAPRLLIVVNPTRGFDVSAAAFVHARLREHRERASIALFSTDLDEVTQLADRVAVMSAGRIVGVVPPDTPRAALGLLMGGG